MKYIILKSDAVTQLQEFVQEAIDDGGYTPVGGLAIDSAGNFYQALTKKL